MRWPPERVWLSVTGIGAVLLALAPSLLRSVPRASGLANEQTSGSAEGPRGAARFAEMFDVSTFQKGNLHTHTTESDGDSSPEVVIAWYRSHGYQFVALTDHNHFTDPARFASYTDDGFALLAGEEVTMTGAGRQVHVNALCTERGIGGGAFRSASEALEWAIGQVDAQNGVALVNHPNFDDALAISDVVTAHGASLLEIKSGHPYVYDEGHHGRPSHEALWDMALTAGERWMGVAVDDMHHLDQSADPPAFPGRAWVQVFSPSADAGAICQALRDNALYSSTGAALRRIRVTAESYDIWPEDGAAIVTFVGSAGRALARGGPRAPGEPASYTPRTADGYVRARVTSPDGTAAWTPAVRVLSSD